MFFLTFYAVVTISIILKCASKPSTNAPAKKMETSKKTTVTTKPMKKNISKKKKNSAKKNKSSAKKQKLSTTMLQEKTAIAKTPAKEDKPLKPSPIPKPSPTLKATPTSDGQVKKKDRVGPRKPEKTAQKYNSPVSEALQEVKKKTSIKAATPKEGTIYGEDEKKEMKKIAKTQSMTTVQESKEEPPKVFKLPSESSAKRHRDALKPGEVNDKSDDTIEDAPSVRRKEGPSYESDGVPSPNTLPSPNEKPDELAIKKLSKEKDQEAAK